MFENDQYEKKELHTLAECWLKGQPFKKDEMTENGKHQCVHYGELFTKYGVVIDQVDSRTDSNPIRISEQGDILFPASDVTPIGLTKCSAINKQGVVLGGDIIIMRPIAGLNSVYLSYAIRMQKEQLLSRVTGAVVRHISAKGLRSVIIPAPPRTLQDGFEMILRQSDKSKLTNCRCSKMSTGKNLKRRRKDDFY